MLTQHMRYCNCFTWVSGPSGAIILVSLISPSSPKVAAASTEQFEKGSRTAGLDNFVLLVRLAGVLALASRKEVHLSSARRESARVSPAHSEENQLGDVPKVEANAPAI